MLHTVGELNQRWGGDINGTGGDNFASEEGRNSRMVYGDVALPRKYFSLTF